MADKDDDTDTDVDDDATSTDTDDGGGDDGSQRALAAERRARRTAEKTLKELQAKLQGLEDKDKTEAQRLTDAVTVAEKRAYDAEQSLLRIEVGADKGLSAAQAKRLVGATREELEADADELLATFGAAGASKPESDAGAASAADKPKPAGRGRPKEDLRSGASPNTDSGDKVDPGKLAASILERPF